MANYLLLRDNKESGPFSMNELLNTGLKPYDLVWVQGKSAAWRYPSEVEELKPYAPVVEEQPFDRFFKKPNEEKKEEQPVDKKQDQYAPLPKEEELKFVPKKSVFVTLPGQQQLESQKPVQKPVEQSPVSHAISPTITITENPVTAEIKYSQPLDDIKEMYVKTLQQRKDKIAKKGYWTAMLKKTAVVAGLICIGVLTGFIIKSKPGKSNGISEQMIQASPAVTNHTADKPSLDPISQEEESSSNNTQNPDIQNEEPSLSGNSNELSKVNEEPTTIRIRKETMIGKAEKEEFDNKQEARRSEFDEITGERSRTIRRSGIEEKSDVKVSKSSLNDLVSVASNDYKRVAFGGIRNLFLTVTNNSKYELDNVIVELQYLKPSEEPLRTENIKFKTIAPNASSTIKVPDTNRGIKVSYKIINIESKQNADELAGM